MTVRTLIPGSRLRRRTVRNLDAIVALGHVRVEALDKALELESLDVLDAVRVRKGPISQVTAANLMRGYGIVANSWLDRGLQIPEAIERRIGGATLDLARHAYLSPDEPTRRLSVESRASDPDIRPLNGHLQYWFGRRGLSYPSHE